MIATRTHERDAMGFVSNSTLEAEATLGARGRRRVYLLRHGEVNYFNEDGTRVEDATGVLLTERGRTQARMMGELLSGVPFDRVLHTGLPRTVETTAMVLGERATARAEAVSALREIEPGHIDHVPPERVDAEFVYGFETAADPGMRFARGEAFAAFYERVSNAIVSVLGSGDWSRLLVVAHGGTNRAILSWVTFGGLAAMATFEQDECCLNVFDVDVVDGDIIRRYVRVLTLTPYNLVKDGLYDTTLERLIASRHAHRAR